MSSIGVLGQRIFYGVAAAVTAIAFAMPAIASAAQVTERSVTLSSASEGATNVSYQVAFTPTLAAGAFVVDFCSDSPLVGQTCTTPAGFSATGATDGGSSTGVTVSSVTGAAGQVIIEGALTAAQPVVVNIDGINNPTNSGALYARIVTYDNATNAGNYASETLGTGVQDQGGVAISITPTIGVSGTVLEVLTFCVSGAVIDATCTGNMEPASVKLGNEIGTTGIYALEPGFLHTGDIYTQITTNASSGATIRLKSSAEGCGGLLRAGDADACDIAPALDEGINATTDAKFGVLTSAASATPSVTNASGTLVPVVGSFYNNTDYAMNYVANEETGVTSTFGDPFIDTAGAPANNQNMVLTFGAVANNNTPAGTYSADISLIAVGKF